MLSLFPVVRYPAKGGKERFYPHGERSKMDVGASVIGGWGFRAYESSAAKTQDQPILVR